MFTVNKKDYENYDQVRAFLPAFMARLDELTAAGQYRYNDSFKGHIPGIEGPDEDFAIYMLQGLERINKQNERIAALLADGYKEVTSVAGMTKYSHIVLYPTRRMGGEWAEYRDARLIGYESGEPRAILPKGKRTNGFMVSGRAVLAK